MTTATKTVPALYCGTYRKYNEGSIFGRWMCLGDYLDAEEFLTACASLHDDESDPEFMFQDFEGFPERMYGESMGTEDIQKIYDWINLDDDDRAMLAAYWDNADDTAELSDVRDLYYGHYDSWSDFVDEYVSNFIVFPNDIFERYFDYESFGRDLEYDFCVCDVEGGIVVFTNC